MSFLRSIIALIALPSLVWADVIGDPERGLFFRGVSVREQAEPDGENACLAFRFEEWTGVAFMKKDVCLGAVFLAGKDDIVQLSGKLATLIPQLEWKGKKCRAPQAEGEVFADGGGIAVYASKIRKVARVALPKKFLGMPIVNVYMRLATPSSYEDGCLVWTLKHGYLRVPLKDGEVEYMEWKFKKDAPSKIEDLVSRIAEATYVPLTKSEGVKTIPGKDKVFARGKRTSEVLVAKKSAKWPYAVCMTDRKSATGKEIGEAVIFPEVSPPDTQSELAQNAEKAEPNAPSQESAPRADEKAVVPQTDHPSLLRAFMERLKL